MESAVKKGFSAELCGECRRSLLRPSNPKRHGGDILSTSCRPRPLSRWQSRHLSGRGLQRCHRCRLPLFVRRRDRSAALPRGRGRRSGLFPANPNHRRNSWRAIDTSVHRVGSAGHAVRRATLGVGEVRPEGPLALAFLHRLPDCEHPSQLKQL